MSVPQEHRDAASATTVHAIILTCTDTRTLENDRSGARIAALLRDAGHDVMDRRKS